MREPTFLILTALCREPLHGYAIVKEVTEISAGEVTLRVGTLYGALDRLTEEGLVAIDREEIVDSRLRRYYRLTSSGAADLSVEALRRKASAESALRRLTIATVTP
jgi:DNA-binding PadR family transcriptional regulator